MKTYEFAVRFLFLGSALFLKLFVPLAAEQPNVLFIAADDLRNDLGCYGNPIVQTPNLDRLAAQGRMFNRAYCQQAVCNPSRASLLTGRRPNTLGFWNLATHFREKFPDVVTLPQHFKNQGYFTENIGKIFHNWRQDDFKGDAPSWSVPAVMHYATHGSDRPQVNGELPPNQAVSPKCERRDVPDEAYFDGRIAQLAVEALGRYAKRREPFFLAVGFWKPHSPFNAPSRYWDLYERDQIDMPINPNWPVGAPPIAWHNSREIRGNPGREMRDYEAREIRHGYYAAISYMDAQVGRVLDELDRLKLSEDTVVVFWSDHGYHLGEQTLWAKTSNFELDARVPLIIRQPEMKQGGKPTNALAELLDLFPTLVDLCGLPMPNGLEGKSLAPILNDPDTSVKAAAFTQHPRPAYYQEKPEVMGVSMRSDQYRYTEWRDFNTGGVVARELYDHYQDPHETRNVVNDVNLGSIAKNLEATLIQTFPKKP